MTDKELIKAEIERLIRDLGEQRDINLEELLDYINSLPEEPVSNMWHKRSEEPEGGADVLVWTNYNFFVAGKYDAISKEVRSFCFRFRMGDVKEWMYVKELRPILDAKESKTKRSTGRKKPATKVTGTGRRTKRDSGAELLSDKKKKGYGKDGNR